MAAARAPFNVTDKISPEAEAAERSPWHSPVPYLFGGLAAMLGLIAFALLILACSYWKLSGYLENGDGERDLEAGGEGKQSETEKVNQSAMEPKFLVIMAGQVKPTFLATPVTSSSSRSSSFGSKSEKSSGEEESEKQGKDDSVCVCGESNNQMRSGSTTVESEPSEREES